MLAAASDKFSPMQATPIVTPSLHVPDLSAMTKLMCFFFVKAFYRYCSEPIACGLANSNSCCYLSTLAPASPVCDSSVASGA